MRKYIISVFVFLFFIGNLKAQEIQKDSVSSLQETNIKEVTINWKKGLIKSRLDGLVYNVQSDPESNSKNLLEMMKKMPYLSVDSNENILFKGTGNFKILMNGKETQLLNNNAKDILRSIPANTIQSIEIITNPSSKYEAEGVAGIINIITTKKMRDGYNASVNTGTRFPKQEQNLGFSLNMKHNKIGISAYGGAFLRNSPETENQNKQQTSSDNLLQNGKIKEKGKGGYLGASVSYEIDSLKLLSIQLVGNASGSRTENQLDSYFYGQDIPWEKSFADINSKNNDRGFEVSANYQMGFKKDKSQLLTFSYRLSDNNSHFESSSAIFNDKANTQNQTTQNNQNKNNEQTFQIDFVKNIDKIFLETGLKAIFRKNRSEYASVPENLNNSDEYLNHQNIYGAYLSARYTLLGWNFQTGLRLENTTNKADFTSTNTSVNQDYFNLIPNVSINKNWKEHHSINFGFSQRIKRPGINRLNPFVNTANPYFETSGNPYLKAVINNDIVANYSYNSKVNFNIGLGYSFSNKIDLKVSTYDPATHITKTTYENSSKVSRFGLDYNLNYPVTKKLTLGINGNSAFFLISGKAEGIEVKNNLFTYYIYLSVNYQLENNWSVNSNLEINSKMPAGLQNKTNAFTGTSFRVSKSLLNNQFSISGYINNPFSKFRTIITETAGANFYQNSYMKDYYRSFGVNVTYKFGKLKQEIKSTRRKIENNDVAN